MAEVVPPEVTALVLPRDPAQDANVARVLGRPEAELVAAEVERAHAALELAEEARALMALVG
jgi:hypothetical protein